MFKNKKFILTAVLPVIVSLIIGIIIISVSSSMIINMRANATVNDEMNVMQNDIERFKDEKIDLQYEAANLDKQIQNDKILLDEILALKTDLSNYDTDITNANNTIAQLDLSIQEKTKYNENLDKLNNNSTSTQNVYTNVKLNVPSDITSGRYTATGTGKIYIYTIANTLEEKIDLSLLDSQSYSFNVSSGQYIKVEGTITLTNIK